ncbi:MAG TPA: zinc ribbon domain-containing protein [Gemmatimonadaceae bacterium]
MASTTTSGTTTCPSCASPASGRFCASCGAPLEGAVCGACHAALTPGAKFCHRCGTAVGAVPATPAGSGAGAGGAGGAPSGFPAALPWAVAGIALLALIALVAGQRFGKRPAAEPGSAADAPAAQAEGGGGGGGVTPVRAPDISSLSPRERADRLYDRIMRLDSEGKKDSVQFFAQMAISAYQMLPEQDLDTRYDMGRIAEVAGATPLARAQADSILAADSTHLLGLILAISTARDANDTAAARALERRLVAAQPSELAKNLPEYQRHEREIAAAIDDARKHQ